MVDANREAVLALSGAERSSFARVAGRRSPDAEASNGARDVVRSRLAREMGKELPAAILERAFSELVFSTDPLENELRKDASDARRLGFLKSADIDGIFDPRFTAAEAAVGRTR
jgi:hypothetical protein